MEASVVVAEAPAVGFDGHAEATRPTSELFKWSEWVHIGVEPEGCDHATDGKCTNEDHFHAWVCVANSFQIRDIADKARAAKARKARALRDPATDSYEVLEADLYELQHDRYDQLVEGIARANVEKRLPEIVNDLREQERFEHQAQDAEEFNRLRELPEEERDAEEFERLQAQMTMYGEELQKVIDAQVEREQQVLRSRPPEEVVEVERRARIDAIATDTYLHTYYTWATYVGTRIKRGSPVRKFERPEDLRNAPPEVTLTLRDTLRSLEQRMMARSDAAGN